MRAQQALAVGQVGLAVALLVTAALLVESFRQLRSVDPGFKPAQVTTARLTLPASRYPDGTARTRFIDQSLAGLRSLPGVMSVEPFRAVAVRLRNGHRSRDLAINAHAADSDLSRVVDTTGWLAGGSAATMLRDRT